jgi:hypothetical protein
MRFGAFVNSSPVELAALARGVSQFAIAIMVSIIALTFIVWVFKSLVRY